MPREQRTKARAETGQDDHPLHSLAFKEDILHVSDTFEERRAGLAVQQAEGADREDPPASCDTLWEEVSPSERARREIGKVRLAPLIAVVSRLGDAYVKGALGLDRECFRLPLTRAERRRGGSSRAARCANAIINTTMSSVRVSRCHCSCQHTLRRDPWKRNPCERF